MPIDPSIALGVRPPQINSPMQAMEQAYTLRNLQAQAELAPQERLSLLAERNAGIQERNLQTAIRARQMAGLEARASIAKDPKFSNPDGTPNYQAQAQELTARGFADEGDSLLKTADTNATALSNIRKAQADWQDRHNELLGGMASTLLRDPKSTYQDFVSNLHILAAEPGSPISEDDARTAEQQVASAPDPEQAWRAVATHYAQLAPSAQKQAIEENKPVTVAPGASVVRPSTGQVVYKGEGTPTESKPMLVDGKPTEVVFDPRTRKVTRLSDSADLTGHDIRPMPPAQILVNNAAAAATSNIPSWALDDSRPTGADANKVDPTIRRTPNGLYQDAQTFIATGQYPPTGRGNDPAAQAVRTAVDSKVGAIAASAGMDVPTLRAFYKANSGSLGQLQKSYDSVQSFMATADKNADLLRPLLDKIPDVNSPLLNQPLRSLNQKALGSVSMSQFKIYVQSIQNEYARILTQPNLAGQLTDSARKEAEQLIDPNATAAQIIGAVSALKTEGENRITSLGEQIQRIQGRIQGGPKPATTPNGDQTRIRVKRKSDGATGTMLQSDFDPAKYEKVGG